MIAYTEKKRFRNVQRIVHWFDPIKTSILEKKSRNKMNQQFVCNSREQDNMLEMNGIRSFAAKLCAKMHSFKIMDESEISRIVVLQNEVRYVDRWIKGYCQQMPS